MAQENQCPQCSANLPLDAPEGLCPKCLMKAVQPSDADATLEESHLIEGPGTKIGRYELLELIGEGGMGLVYLAEQKEPVKRRVALKIIKPGMDSRQVVARFEAERQALALLEHPNIAHVFDAGTTGTGRPYFVMEHVKGMSITMYCDDRKLNIEQRLKLFKQVCEGIHHAHQKGIIHRDIKPSNILVSVHGDRAVPKIIDFGIAKATARSLTDKTVFTCQGQLLGTPEYMSPEQVDLATQDIDTRSDIYSLGVLLYELLAGVLPFEEKLLRSGGFAEIQRTIRELEPATPSTRLTNLGEQAKEIARSRKTQAVALARRLHRELEWIPLKAMRKDRCRRYRSASEMADDIQNYLNGSPLIAGPETARYHMQKFVRKHAGSVATVALVAAAIVLGLVVSTAMYFRAEKAEKAAEEKSEELRRTLYVNSIQFAGAKYGEGNMRRVRELLELCPNDLRGWEWYRLNHISDQARMTLRGHDGAVYSVALSTDGERIASGSFDETIKVWDTATGAELMTLRGHRGPVVSIEFSPDGKRIVSGGDDKGDDKTVKVWDAVTGTELMTLYGHKRWINLVAFSPDGKCIVSGSADNTIKVWDAATGNELMTLRGHSNWVQSVAFSPDGLRVVSGSRDGTIKVWDAATGAEVMTLRANIDWILSVAFSPDGKRIISSGADDTIRLWDGSTGAELMTFRGHKLAVADVAFSPDGKRIVSGSFDGTIKVWDASTGTKLMTLVGHENEVWSVAFSPDGMHIISSGEDKTIKVWDAVWDAAIREEVVTLSGHRGPVFSIAFSPDGKRLVSGSGDETIKVWDAANGAELMTLRGHDDYVGDASFSPDGRRIVSCSKDSTVRVWDTATGEEVMILRGHKGGGRCVTFSPDGKRIISGSSDGAIKVWDGPTGAEVMTLRGDSDFVYSVAFSPDGKRIVSGSWDPTIKVWDAGSGAEVLTLHGDGPVMDVAFSPDGKRIISGSLAGTVKVWDSATGTELMTLVVGLESDVTSVAFSPDGKTIAAGCFDNGIKLWESTTPAGGYELRWNAEAARKVVDDLYEEQGLYSKVIDELNADETLDESVRKLALQIANARLWEDGEKTE